MNDKIINRLRKLIRHEKSAREIGSLREAEVFAGKIQQLLDEYNLSLSEIDMEEARSSVGAEKCDVKCHHRWQEIFLNNMAGFNGCIVVFGGGGFTIVGNEMDRLIVVEIYEYFEDLARALSDIYIREYQQTRSYRLKRRKHMHSRRERDSYLLGFITALLIRFREKHEANLAAASNSTALIYIGNKLADADMWKEDNMDTITVQRPKLKRSSIRQDAYGRGMADGESVALTTKTIS